MGFLFVYVLATFVVVASGNLCTAPDRYTAVVSSVSERNRPSEYRLGQVFVDRTLGLMYIEPFELFYNITIDLNNNVMTMVDPDAENVCFSSEKGKAQYVILDIPDDAVKESEVSSEVGTLSTYSFKVPNIDDAKYYVTVDEDCHPRFVRSYYRDPYNNIQTYFTEDFQSIRAYFNIKPLDASYQFPQNICPLDEDYINEDFRDLF